MHFQNYVMRTNTTEDDGQLQQHTVQNISKMAANLTGSARVYLLLLLEQEKD